MERLLIRAALPKDIDRLLSLLSQVLEIHARIRPDIFVSGTTKYKREELLEKLDRENERIFVAVNEKDEVIGYAFCVVREPSSLPVLVAHKIMFVDDLCVSDGDRGKGIGRALFDHVVKEAKKIGCYEVTLNVWEGNEARAFYEKLGMKPKETQMEYIL